MLPLCSLLFSPSLLLSPSSSLPPPLSLLLSLSSLSSLLQNIRQLTEDWRELDNVYRREAKKKRSKFSREELDGQQHIVVQMNDEIGKVKELQRSGYLKMGVDGGEGGGGSRMVAMDQSSLFTDNIGDSGAGFGGGGSVAVGEGGIEMTGQQRSQVQAIHDRDKEFDTMIGAIGQGVLNLQDIAVAQNEEVTRQNVMLESLAGKIDNVHDHGELEFALLSFHSYFLGSFRFVSFVAFLLPSSPPPSPFPPSSPPHPPPPSSEQREPQDEDHSGRGG